MPHKFDEAKPYITADLSDDELDAFNRALGRTPFEAGFTRAQKATQLRRSLGARSPGFVPVEAEAILTAAGIPAATPGPVAAPAAPAPVAAVPPRILEDYDQNLVNARTQVMADWDQRIITDENARDLFAQIDLLEAAFEADTRAETPPERTDPMQEPVRKHLGEYPEEPLEAEIAIRRDREITEENREELLNELARRELERPRTAPTAVAADVADTPAPTPAPPAATTATAAAAGGIGGWFTGVWGAIRGRPPVATPTPGAAAAAPPAPAAAGAPTEVYVERDRGIGWGWLALAALIIYLFLAYNQDWFPFDNNDNAVPASSQSSNNPSNSGGGNVNGGGSTNNSGGGNGGGTTASAVACLTDAQMQQALGFNFQIKPVTSGEGIAWEGCKWNWQANGLSTFRLNLPADWALTATMQDDTVRVWYGPANDLVVKGFTLRYLPYYKANTATQWVTDACEFIKRENAFGQRRDPSYDTVSGNVVCKGQPTSSGSAGSSSSATTTTQSANTPPAKTDRCPTSSAAAAQLLSGGQGTWTDLGSESGTHKWKFKSGTGVTLTYPGFGSFDHWKLGDGYKGDIPGADDATFNCS